MRRRTRRTPDRQGSGAVLDIIYIACTIAFFALMLAFVRGLEILGRDAAVQAPEKP